MFFVNPVVKYESNKYEVAAPEQTNKPHITIELLKEKIDEHRIWVDETFAMLQKFVCNDEYYKDIMQDNFQHALSSSAQKEGLSNTDLNYFERLISVVNDLNDSIENGLKDITILREVKKKLDDHRVELGEKEYQAELKLILDSLTKRELLVKENQEAIVDLEVCNKKYNKNIPDWLLLKNKFHYASATSNRTPLGVFCNPVVDHTQDILTKKSKLEKLSDTEEFLLQLIDLYSLLNNCAANAQKALSPTEKLLTPFDALLDQKRVGSPIKRRPREQDNILLFIEQYFLNCDKCIKYLDGLIDKMQKCINKAPTSVKTSDRLDFRLLSHIEKTKKSLEELKSLVQQSPHLKIQVQFEIPTSPRIKRESDERKEKSNNTKEEVKTEEQPVTFSLSRQRSHSSSN